MLDLIGGSGSYMTDASRTLRYRPTALKIAQGTENPDLHKSFKWGLAVFSASMVHASQFHSAYSTRRPAFPGGDRNLLADASSPQF